VAVAVNPDELFLVEEPGDVLHDPGGEVCKGRQVLGRDEPAAGEKIQIVPGGLLRAEDNPVIRDPLLAREVDPCDEPPHPPQVVAGVDLELAARFLGEEREESIVRPGQGVAAGQGEGADHGNLGCRAIREEPVLVFERDPAPAARPVELGDYPLSTPGLQLVDPVDIAGQGHGEPCHGDTGCLFHEVQQNLWG
jgi:hypothetical protein